MPKSSAEDFYNKKIRQERSYLPTFRKLPLRQKVVLAGLMDQIEALEREAERKINSFAGDTVRFLNNEARNDS